MEMSLANTKTWHNAERLLEILHALSYRTGNLGDYLQTIASGVSELVGVDWSVVTFCEDDVEQVVASSLDAGAVGQSYSLHGLLTGYVVAHGHSLVVNDVEQHPEYGCGPPGYRSYLGIPLRTPQGQVIGTICSFHRQPRSFEDGEIRIVEMFAERAAIVLDNYHLYERERRFHSHLKRKCTSAPNNCGPPRHNWWSANASRPSVNLPPRSPTRFATPSPQLPGCCGDYRPWP